MKTADEMLRELGYEKHNIPRVFRYIKKSDGEGEMLNEEVISVYAYGDHKCVTKDTFVDGHITGSWFSPDELRAVTKLLDEMGV